MKNHFKKAVKTNVKHNKIKINHELYIYAINGIRGKEEEESN